MAKTKTPETEQRPISVIIWEIREEWPEPYFGAVPYLDALGHIENITECYSQDDARSLVLYLLSNMATWRGDAARRLKAELKALL